MTFVMIFGYCVKAISEAANLLINDILESNK
jgi:hypothetical protein